MSTSRFGAVAAIFTLTALLGASQRALGDEELASVKGRVTLNGRPLSFGKIIFHLADGQFVGSKIKDDGSFKIDRVPPGALTVTVEATRKTKTALGKEVLPERYAQEEKSELRVEVKKGRNELDFRLTSR
jgi:hypothetical protein